MARKIIDEVGNRYGRLLVLEEAGRANSKHVLWKCRCDCGNEIVVASRSLRRLKGTKSCGCLQKERTSETHKNIKRPKHSERMRGENNSNYIDGRCNDFNEYVKLWQKNNPDKVNAYAANYKAKKVNQSPTNANKELIQFYHTICSTMKDYEVDHIQPVSKGGLNHEDNLQLLEKHLNREKSAKWPLSPAEKIRYRGIRL